MSTKACMSCSYEPDPITGDAPLFTLDTPHTPHTQGNILLCEECITDFATKLHRYYDDNPTPRPLYGISVTYRELHG